MWVCFGEGLPTIIWVWLRSALVRLWHGHCHHVGMNRVCFDESLPWMLPLCGCEWGLLWWGSVMDTTTIWVWMGSVLVRVCLPCDRVYFGWGSALVRLWHGHCHHVGVNRVCFDEGLPWTLSLCGYEWGQSAIDTATMWVWMGSAPVMDTCMWIWMGLWWGSVYHHMGVIGVYIGKALTWALPSCGYEWSLLWWWSVIDTATININRVCSGEGLSWTWHGHCDHVGVNGVCYRHCLVCGYNWGLLWTPPCMCI